MTEVVFPGVFCIETVAFVSDRSIESFDETYY